jgi:hypothetical protein
MERNMDTPIDQYIRDAAQEAAADGGLPALPLERFLRTGEETWDGAGSGRFTRAQLNQDKVFSQAAKTSLRKLLGRLAALLPADSRLAPAISQESIRQRVEPMVKGLVQRDWQDVALREVTRRTFVLNYQGTMAALEAELSTGWLKTAWQVLWACFADYGLKPVGLQIECDGLSGGEFAHVRWPAYETTDSYSDVVVHEAAHLLHYLKPEHYGLHARRGQERFVDVEFRHRELFAFACEAYSRVVLQGERKSRISFAARMREDAFTFSLDYLDDVAALVLTAAGARSGWRVIREATVVRRVQKAQVGNGEIFQK